MEDEENAKVPRKKRSELELKKSISQTRWAITRYIIADLSYSTMFNNSFTQCGPWKPLAKAYFECCLVNAWMTAKNSKRAANFPLRTPESPTIIERPTVALQIYTLIILYLA